MTEFPNQALARMGESLAETSLVNKKYRILARNYRCAVGEMDIIAQKGDRTIVFVEVKTRSSQDFGEPEEAVHAFKKRKLFQVAQYYLKQTRLEDWDVQIDVVAVLVLPGEEPKVTHFENALEF